MLLWARAKTPPPDVTGYDLQRFRGKLRLTQKQMAKRLGVSKSLYEILESSQSLVPDPLPVHVADRLNAMRQTAAGQVRKMPEIHCPLHPDYWLRQHRGRWLGKIRGNGKMKRWWAYCPSGGEFGKLYEIYTVRVDGLVHQAPKRKRAKLAGGRSPKAESEKQNFRVGREVERLKKDTFLGFFEVKSAQPKRTNANKDLLRRKLAAAGFRNEEIDAGLSARTAKIAARNFVASDRRLEYSTVAKYHRELLRTEGVPNS
jgi:hypothetical protein